MLNIESVTPLEHYKPRRRSLAYCISPDEGQALVERWCQRFPKLRYMAPLENMASTYDAPRPPELAISGSPFDLPFNTQVAGVLIGDRWKPRWKKMRYTESSTDWRITNVPWPRFNLSLPVPWPRNPQSPYEYLDDQDIQVIWNYGNDDGAPMMSYLFSTIRALINARKAICLKLSGDDKYWHLAHVVGYHRCSAGALAWAAAKPGRVVRLGGECYLPIDADLAKLGFGDIPHRAALDEPARESA